MLLIRDTVDRIDIERDLRKVVYTSNWVAELFGPSNLKKFTSGFPQRLYNSVLQGALGIDKDGIFGANTEKTVKEFQSAHGLTVDGIAGAKTKAALAKQL